MESEICTKHYYVYNEVLAGIDIVKNYIRANKQVLVGGQSIDYALRLKGTNLYKDWEIPDLDFQTDDYANVAYEIFRQVGEKLHKQVDVGVINAMHHTTMRVQVAKFCVADVTYVPTRIIKMYKKSALTYDGCLLRHPIFQYIDIQRSFSYPYENPMREVVQHRWEKDYKRFMLTMEYYSPSDRKLLSEFISCYNSDRENKLKYLISGKSIPYPTTVKSVPGEVITLYKQVGNRKKPVAPYIANGELAYIVYRYIYKMILGKKCSVPVFDGYYEGSDYFLNSYIMTADDKDVFCIEHAAEMINVRTTHPYLDVIPARTIFGDWEVLNVDHKTGYHTIDLPGIKLRVVSINYLALYISMLWITLGTDIYLSMYLKLLRMMERVYKMPDSAMVRLMYPSVIAYGAELPHIFEQNSLSFSKPESIFINKYNPVELAVSKIQKYEYPEIYNLDGL